MCHSPRKFLHPPGGHPVGNEGPDGRGCLAKGDRRREFGSSGGCAGLLAGEDGEKRIPGCDVGPGAHVHEHTDGGIHDVRGA